MLNETNYLSNLDGMVGYSADRSEKADPDSAESVDETLAETLRPLTPRYLVPATVLLVQWKTIEVSWHAAREVSHRS